MNMKNERSMLMLICSLLSCHMSFSYNSMTNYSAQQKKQAHNQKTTKYRHRKQRYKKRHANKKNDSKKLSTTSQAQNYNKKPKKRKRYVLNAPEPIELEQHTHYRKARWPAGATRPAKFFGGILKDIFMVNANLFSWDSFKIIASVFPFFIGTRMIDEKIHKHFYDESRHKNIHQMPKWCSELGKYGIGVPIALLGINAFIPYNKELQETSRIFLIGMPFVIWGKELIKKSRFDACFRPWNENFSCKQRALGGFPSGHMAEATYTAVLYGLRYGPVAAIPLSFIALLVATSFINCNRHYASQIVGGAGFGAMYALAGHKVIDAKLKEKENMRLGMAFDDGKPAISFSYNF